MSDYYEEWHEALAEIERLTAVYLKQAKAFDQALGRIERLTAENEQFRAALEEIEENATSEFEDGWCGDLAREALAALKPIRSY